MVLTATSWQDTRIIVVGDVMLDVYKYGKIKRINPERPGALLLHVEKTEYHLGGAANVAHNILTLKGNPSLVGIVGKDHFAYLFKSELKKTGFSSQLYRDESRPTTVKTRVVEQSHNDQLCRVDEELTHPVAVPLAARLVDQTLPRLNGQHALVLSDYAKGLLTPEVIIPLLQYAQQHRLPVLVDPKPANIDLFVGCTVATPNLGEAEGIVGSFSQPSSREAYLETLCRRLQDRMQTPLAIITCGSEGIVGIDQKGQYHHAYTPEVKTLFDVVGAGDAVLATLALYFGHHYGKSSFDFGQALQLANLAGYVKVGKTGTSTVTLEEVLSAHASINSAKAI
ncbi:hypothetical protein J4208_05390 [Candidatus Woesearchaeota archaeon]|nr:hypothetical protein [Candidatus Woesearchaeota archaeon]